jgi:hypothetical protein
MSGRDLRRISAWPFRNGSFPACSRPATCISGISRRDQRFVELQDRYDCLYCVVDLHAITVWQEPAELPHAIREVTAAFIACGIDPTKHIVFNQSQVAEHAELAWIFNCVARLGWLNRMTQFKEKAGKNRENASVGLYDYPTLMAADILLTGRRTCRSARIRAAPRNCRVTSRSSTTISGARSTNAATAPPSSRCRSR